VRNGIAFGESRFTVGQGGVQRTNCGVTVLKSERRAEAYDSFFLPVGQTVRAGLMQESSYPKLSRRRSSDRLPIKS